MTNGHDGEQQRPVVPYTMELENYDGSKKEDIPAVDVLAVTQGLKSLMDMADYLTTRKPETVSGVLIDKLTGRLKGSFRDALNRAWHGPDMPYDPYAAAAIRILEILNKPEEEIYDELSELEVLTPTRDEDALKKIKHHLETILPGREIDFRVKGPAVIGVFFKTMSDSELESLSNRVFVLDSLRSDRGEYGFNQIKVRDLHECAVSCVEGRPMRYPPVPVGYRRGGPGES